MKCRGLTKDGSACGRKASKNGFCQWHQDQIIVEPREFDGWSKNEICTYVKNFTNGRVILDEKMPLEAVEERAYEAVS